MPDTEGRKNGGIRVTETDELWYDPGLTLSYGILLLDGSGSMQSGSELKTGKIKHRAVAEMVLDLIRLLKDDPEVQDMMLSVICFDGHRVDDFCIEEYFVKENPEWHFEPPYPKQPIDKLDPIVGHGGTTPIGLALGFAKELAQDWVLKAPKGYLYRAAICLLTDGQNYPEDGPNGTEEKEEIIQFNEEHEAQGRIRVATVGYYQHPKGEDEDEDKGRTLLQSLADHNAYFETSEASKIADFLRRTLPPT